MQQERSGRFDATFSKACKRGSRWILGRLFKVQIIVVRFCRKFKYLKIIFQFLNCCNSYCCSFIFHGYVFLIYFNLFCYIFLNWGKNSESKLPGVAVKFLEYQFLGENFWGKFQCRSKVQRFSFFIFNFRILHFIARKMSPKRKYAQWVGL